MKLNVKPTLQAPKVVVPSQVPLYDVPVTYPSDTRNTKASQAKEDGGIKISVIYK